ncbi:MAG: 1-deoxy-D-xylulose-5-phosphate reductoisomerase [Bacteroidales bacterium]|jgi:1-deoxy-D-xylulose-5-phosphate reductoisomerase|nr:1-deoxy-D-xylulose-5-phosphate reductoisomerase [Bacteroidales bacterium]
MKKRIAILGSTGSIGTQTLEVIKQNPELFSVEVLTASNNVDLLIKQAILFKPNSVVIANDKKYNTLSAALKDYPIKIFAGSDAIAQIVEMDSIDIVLTAIVGFAGLMPTINAIKAKKTIALANKETLVVAGELINKLAQQNHVNIIPVDSEHSAIFQCLVGERNNNIEKIILTASGGPFRNSSIDFLSKVTKKDALKHPNWDMGAKITIDSATMMNKGFEVIEAKWLFDLNPNQIDVIVHPQSIVHSLVQFEDSSIKAQMGLPDMKLPIVYALGYPDRIKTNFERFDFLNYPELSFEKPDIKKFRNLDYAYFAMKKGGNIPCILNAANEIVVNAFLNDKIGFLEMFDLIENSLQKIKFISNPILSDYQQTDFETRNYTESLIN